MKSRGARHAVPATTPNVASSVRDYYANLPPHACYRAIPMICVGGLHELVEQAAVEVLAPGASILDVGCGQGAFSLRMADRGFEVHACDVFEPRQPLPGVHFVQASAEDLPRGAKYDAVFLIEMLEHVPSPEAVLRTAAAKLKPGGFLFVTTPNVDSDFSRAWFLLTGRHWYFEDVNLRQDGHETPLHDFQLRHYFSRLGVEVQRAFRTPERRTAKGLVFRTLLGAMQVYHRAKRVSPNRGEVSVYVARMAGDRG